MKNSESGTDASEVHSARPMPRLEDYSTPNFTRGMPAFVEVLWIVVQCLLIASDIPGSAHRKFLLRLFGAKIGQGVVIKAGVRIKFPWHLEVGNHSWIGERAWIDNLAKVSIGSNACISQGAYLCTGSHDWSSPTFDLIVKPISIGSGAWVTARSTIGPGVTIGEGAVLGLGSTTSKDLEAWCVYSGSPAEFVGRRILKPQTPM
jgi:putative colanic acid biosynthesis acetyltransferase WcaF